MVSLMSLVLVCVIDVDVISVGVRDNGVLVVIGGDGGGAADDVGGVIGDVGSGVVVTACVRARLCAGVGWGRVCVAI